MPTIGETSFISNNFTALKFSQNGSDVTGLNALCLCKRLLGSTHFCDIDVAMLADGFHTSHMVLWQTILCFSLHAPRRLSLFLCVRLAPVRNRSVSSTKTWCCDASDSMATARSATARTPALRLRSFPTHRAHSTRSVAAIQRRYAIQRWQWS